MTRKNCNDECPVAAVGVLIGVLGAIYLAPLAVAAIGFKASGIAAGSTASWLMSTMGGGATTSGSTVAILQSVGATGSVLGSTTATAVTAGTGALLGASITQSPCYEQLIMFHE